ncbi:MAG: glycosyltransferase, partial [Nitrospirae bacterium]|nr:glycosyltransferase [Nitrospirota bacterium]
GEFDAVFIWDNLGFVENIRGFLKEVQRIIKKDGYISIRSRDAFSRINESRGIDNFISGDPNFIGRKYLRRIYRDYFNEAPQCFMQEAYKDSVIVTIGKSNSGALRNYSMNVLLMVHHYLFSKLDDATGPRGRVLNTIDMLDRFNVKADISLSLTPGAAGYDLVHLFHNAWETQDALSQMISAKQDNAKVIISTIYMDPSETNFVINTINKIFKIPGQDERDAFLNMLAQGKLKAGNLTQGMRFYAKWNIEEDQKALLEMADRLICFSYTEMRQMSLNLNRVRPFSIVYNSANDETFGACGPEIFIESYGIKDFVIAAGHVEWRKNQLMMLYALRNNPEIPIVIVGARTNDEYYELCKLWAHKNTTFISQLKHRHLASAFAAARVHAQPSWIEGISLSAIEAAMCGCTPVVADRAGEIEYYGEFGAYANPGSIDSIRRAVLTAYHKSDPGRRQKTAEYVKARYTFKNAVEMTIDAYRKTLNGDE